MQSVHVRVGGENDLLVAQALDVILNIQTAHEVVHFVVFIDDVPLEVPDVERLALEYENRLRVHVAATHNRAGGGLAFGNKNHRPFAFALGFVEMDFAILELRDSDGDGPGAFAGEFLHLLQFLAELLRVFDLRNDFLRDLLVAMEEMEQFFADFVDQFRADFRVAEFVLGLRLEDRVFEPKRDRADHALAHVVAFVAGLGILVHRFEQALAERAQVRAAVGSVLAVDKREERLAVAAVGVGETEFERLARVMERRINRLAVVRLQVFHHQVEQAVAGLEGLAVVNQFQPRVEIAVMAQPFLNELRTKFDFLENVGVRLEPDERAVGFVVVLSFLFVLQLALLEPRLDVIARSMTANEKFFR